MIKIKISLGINFLTLRISVKKQNGQNNFLRLSLTHDLHSRVLVSAKTSGRSFKVKRPEADRFLYKKVYFPGTTKRFTDSLSVSVSEGVHLQGPP